ncbi:HAD hydrolase-like protein [Tardiphaga sp. 37S4]|uniref:HAD hydrolase-like protein n=1 Tax=Tardiphaga sp. 37S4 TaxID=1404741 RepID=UPI0021135D18|nr:HAD hydrolase-like protein [Tardiphaga sp. 37S4]
MPYKLAIFDFDGTLSDSFSWFLSVINSVADKHKFQRVERDRIDELRSVGAGELIRLLGVAKWRDPVDCARHAQAQGAADRPHFAVSRRRPHVL